MNKKGISLIVLVITIIVLAILATTTVITMNNSGLIPFTQNAAFKGRVSTYLEELSYYHAKEQSTAYYNKAEYNPADLNKSAGDEVATIITSMKEEDKLYFYIEEGKLKIKINIGETKIKLASELGLWNNMYDYPIHEFPEPTRYTYKRDGDGLILLGFAESYASDKKEEKSELVIPYEYDGKPIRKIGTASDEIGVFSMMSSIETLVIPNTVRYIGSNAFYNCNNLKNVILSAGLQTIGNYAFTNCFSLKSITIPESVTSIKNGAFINCRELENINLPSGILSVSPELFNNCSNLKSVVVPDNVSSIGKLAFNKCVSLESITMPAGVTTISEKAFGDCTGLKTVNFKGTEAQWQELVATIGSGNECLTNATIVYEYGK